MISLIVAMDPNQGIGLNGVMPWHIKEDLMLFKQTTIHHTIIMGTTTFVGLPKALPNRHTIVVSRNENLKFDDINVTVEHDLENLFLRYANTDEEIFVCGGANIYQQSLPYVQKMYISHVKQQYRVDTYFPEVNWKEFEKVKEVVYDEFVYCEYVRKDR